MPENAVRVNRRPLRCGVVAYHEEGRVRAAMSALESARAEVETVLRDRQQGLIDVEDSDMELHAIVGELERIEGRLREMVGRLQSHG